MRMIKYIFAAFVICLLRVGSVEAVPETVGARITDVTPASFSIVWMTDVPANPTVEVFADASMAVPIIEGIEIMPMAGAAPDVALAAREKGIMKVQVTGLLAGTTYYVRAVTIDPVDPQSISYSSPLEAGTALEVKPYVRKEGGVLQGFSNDLLTFKVYIGPRDTRARPGLGDLLVLAVEGSPYPMSAFVGEGIEDPEGVLDLNNLFAPEMMSMDTIGGEKTILRVYRGGTLSTLLHYRRLPSDANTVNASEPVRGFFADINLDANIDETDFNEFKEQYRSVADDDNFNPDYDFIQDEGGRIDAKDFARFAPQYGRKGVK